MHLEEKVAIAVVTDVRDELPRDWVLATFPLGYQLFRLAHGQRI